MEMRVYNQNLTGTSDGCGRTADTQKTDSSGSAAAQSSRQGTGSDQVELSGALGRLSQALSAQGTERAARVASLAAAYQSGSYQPDVLGTSRGLIAEALSAGGGQ